MTATRTVTVRPDAPRTEPPSSSPRVLCVQAPGHPRPGLAERLGRLGLVATVATDVAEALRVLADAPFAACLLDLAADRAALTAIRLIRARHPGLALVGVVDPGVPAVAADALRSGVVDLVCWPIEDHELAAVFADIGERSPAPVRPATFERLVALSPAMRDLLARVRETAVSQQPVALYGAAGTGKVLVARALHDGSAEAGGPFVRLDCALRAPAEIERLLFGHHLEHGGGEGPQAVETISVDGALGQAIGGTLYVRRLDEAPDRVQLRLASMLRNREVLVRERAQTTDLDVRLVASFREPVETLVREGRLRRELAARFSVHLELPALRHRREDIGPLVAGFLERDAGSGATARTLSRAALELLIALPWPGNVPELERLVGELARKSRRPVIQLEDALKRVSIDGAPHLREGMTLREAREQFERDCIASAIARHQGRVGAAARELGIQRTNLYRKVRQLGIPRTLLSGHR